MVDRHGMDLGAIYKRNGRCTMVSLFDASKRTINKHFRTIDDSNLWPINGRFSATERAIRRARKFENDSGIALEGQEYCLFLEAEISRIVNREV